MYSSSPTYTCTVCTESWIQSSQVNQELRKREADGRRIPEQGMSNFYAIKGMTTKSSNNRGGESHLPPPFSLLFSLSPIPSPHILLSRSRDGKPRGKRKEEKRPRFFLSLLSFSLHCTYGVHWMYNRGILSTPQERKGREGGGTRPKRKERMKGERARNSR